jgi:hypothetical protein
LENVSTTDTDLRIRRQLLAIADFQADKAHNMLAVQCGPSMREIFTVHEPHGPLEKNVGHGTLKTLTARRTNALEELPMEGALFRANQDRQNTAQFLKIGQHGGTGWWPVFFAMLAVFCSCLEKVYISFPRIKNSPKTIQVFHFIVFLTSLATLAAYKAPTQDHGQPLTLTPTLLLYKHSNIPPVAHATGQILWTHRPLPSLNIGGPHRPFRWIPVETPVHT